MKRYARSLGLSLGLLLCLFVGSVPALAQSRSVEVERRDARITIQPSGDVRFVETWEVNFIGGPFRFAFRSIPLDRVTDITDWRVSEDGQQYAENGSENPNTFDVTTENGERKITWYFPETSDATRTFLLEYTLRGALRIYPDGDQFFWKFIESDRDYTINSSQVLLTLPAAFAANQLRSTTYLNGTEQQEAARPFDQQTVEFIGGPFPSGTEWELRTQFPHGVVTATVQPWQAREDRAPVYNLIFLAASVLTLIGGLLGLYLLWYARGRDWPVGAASPYYTEPPEELPPGIAGTLLDEKADLQDILATLVDLANRGFLRIEEHQEEGFFRSSSTFRFVRLRSDDDTLRPYEQKLLDKVFGSSHMRDLTDLKEKFYTAIGDLETSLYDETVKVGYFPESPKTTRYKYGFSALALILLVGLGGFFGLALIVDVAPLALLLWIAAGIVAVAFGILSFFMPRKTPAGAAAASKWRAFKRYLEDIDKYTDVAEARDQFARYLPYAIAFGLEQSWVRRFAAVDAPVPGWYYPHGYDFGPRTFSHSRSGSREVASSQGGRSEGSRGGGGAPSLDTMAGGAFRGLNAMSSGFLGMLNTTSSTFTSRPASSGSSGGGGWSGGGGGGGGGSSGFG
ncbi:MAG: DUF2207 domain-containing protein [Chloroflexota bacterium]|nr:DUF2207 domain-containing protein [Chloroflexota bacterium]